MWGDGIGEWGGQVEREKMDDVGDHSECCSGACFGRRIGRGEEVCVGKVKATDREREGFVRDWLDGIDGRELFADSADLSVYRGSGRGGESKTGREIVRSGGEV